MKRIEVSTGYQTQLTPLFNQHGEVVLLYLKDEMKDYQNALKEGEAIIDLFHGFRIKYQHLPEADELIYRIKREYEAMKEQDGVILEDDNGHEMYLSGLEYYQWATEEEKMTLEQYIDSFTHHMMEDITEIGTLWLNDTHDSLVWFIDSPKWIKRLAKNQYRVEVSVTSIESGNV